MKVSEFGRLKKLYSNLGLKTISQLMSELRGEAAQVFFQSHKQIPVYWGLHM